MGNFLRNAGSQGLRTIVVCVVPRLFYVESLNLFNLVLMLVKFLETITDIWNSSYVYLKMLGYGEARWPKKTG